MDVGAPAVVAAIADATGVWIADLPASPERILAALAGRAGAAPLPPGASEPAVAAGDRPMTAYRFTVNDAPVEVDVPGMRRLLDVLREELALTGTKEGCGEGECGACTVLLDGAPVDSCLVPICQVDGATVATVEGLAPATRDPRPAPDGVPRDRRRPVRDLHAGDADGRAAPTSMPAAAPTTTRSARPSPATSAAAPATPRSSRRSPAPLEDLTG